MYIAYCTKKFYNLAVDPETIHLLFNNRVILSVNNTYMSQLEPAHESPMTGFRHMVYQIYSCVLVALLFIRIALYTLPALFSQLLLHFACSNVLYSSKKYKCCECKQLEDDLCLYPYFYFI